MKEADQTGFFRVKKIINHVAVIRLKGDIKMTTIKKKTIAVLFGGCSTEYEVSLQSACSVIENLSQDKYRVILLGITRNGQWLLYDGGLDEIRNDTWSTHESCVPAVISPDRGIHGLLILRDNMPELLPLDVVFPVLHGKNGEDGTIQGLLELAGIPCAGCGTLSSAICMDKDIAHRLAALEGIMVPRSVILKMPLSHSLSPSALHDTKPGLKHDPLQGKDRNPDLQYDPLQEKDRKPDLKHDLMKEVEALKYPLFIKPANAGSSFGITKVDRPEELEDAVLDALIHDSKVLIEEAVPGFEIGCAVLGNDSLTIGELDEIELSQGFFNFTEKYTLQTSKIHLPARVDSTVTTRIKEAAAVIYKALGCKGFARVDFFLTPDCEIYFNEVNTIPGFTAHSRYPSMLKSIGISFSELLDELIRLAVIA